MEHKKSLMGLFGFKVSKQSLNEDRIQSVEAISLPGSPGPDLRHRIRRDISRPIPDIDGAPIRRSATTIPADLRPLGQHVQRHFSSTPNLGRPVQSDVPIRPRARREVPQPILENSGAQYTIDLLTGKVEECLASLRKKDSEISQAKQVIEDLRIELRKQNAENQVLSDDAKDLHTLATEQANQLQSLKGQLDRLQDEKDMRFESLMVSLSEKEIELSARANTVTKLKTHNQQLQTRITELDRILAIANQTNGQDIQTFFNKYETMEITHSEMSKKLHEAEKALKFRESEVVDLGTYIEELEKERCDFDACQPATLRSLLMMRHVEQASIEQAEREPSTWVPTELPNSQLDKVCTSPEIHILAKLLPRGKEYNEFYGRLKFDICSVCSKAKFNITLGTHRNYQSVKWLNEYLGPSRYFTCCQENVCKECFKKHVLEGLRYKWWKKLDTLQWFPCPRRGCQEALGIRCEADLEICLERSLEVPAQEYVKMYSKALVFRKALNSLEPKPKKRALNKAAKVTRVLVESKLMYSPFDPRFDSAFPDETGCIPEFNPGTIYLAFMDEDPSPVPLFSKFFRRLTKPKECMVCSKNMFEIDYGSVESWKEVCKGFAGPWMWKLLLFPTSENQKCDHDFEVCRTCTAEHIRNTLVSGGPSACGNLTCPQCNRNLEHQEIKQLADAETAAKYEKFLLQNFLSALENFRWCLNPVCTSGQVYDYSPRNPKISCEECDFDMCFKHSMPWHEGLTCTAYDSQREHGDPGFAETQAWIRTNTKPCPNPECGTDIQKGEACFHMTCSQCRHEFCWQCLASWSDIRAHGQEGHTEDCFFRTSDVRPTGLRGENLEAALGGRA